MNKLIFLKIDGAIGIHDEGFNTFWNISDEKQDLLGEIINKTDAKIVIIDELEMGIFEFVKDELNESGFRFIDSVVGVTHSTDEALSDAFGKFHQCLPTGLAVNLFLDDYLDRLEYSQHGSPTEPFSYVIIDSYGADIFLSQKGRLILTAPTVGLTKYQVSNAVAILNRMDPKKQCTPADHNRMVYEDGKCEYCNGEAFVKVAIQQQTH